MYDHPVCYAIGIKASSTLRGGSSEDLQSYFKLLVDRLTSAFPEWQDFYVEVGPGGPAPASPKTFSTADGSTTTTTTTTTTTSTTTTTLGPSPGGEGDGGRIEAHIHRHPL
jgi:hypothetical protein